MSNNKTLVSLLFTVAVLATVISAFLPLANIPQQTYGTLFFMVAILLFKVAGAISAGILVMLFVSDRPWRKLRHIEDINFAQGDQPNEVKRQPFNHAYNGHSPK